MSVSVPAGNTCGVRCKSLRVLVLCLTASLALHAMVITFFPEWIREPVSLPLPVLDVVIAAAEPEVLPAIPVLPPQPSPVIPRRAQPTPPIAGQAVTTQPERGPAETKIAVVPADMASPPQFTVPMESPRAAMGIRPMPVAPAEVVTPPALNAAYLRNPPPPYPQAARRNGEEGTVMLRVLVDPEGAPVQVVLDKSSGSSLLDSAAVDAVRSWRFVPARRGRQNVEGWVRVPIVFRLEGLS